MVHSDDFRLYYRAVWYVILAVEVLKEEAPPGGAPVSGLERTDAAAGAGPPAPRAGGARAPGDARREFHNQYFVF